MVTKRTNIKRYHISCIIMILSCPHQTPSFMRRVISLDGHCYVHRSPLGVVGSSPAEDTTLTSHVCTASLRFPWQKRHRQCGTILPRPSSEHCSQPKRSSRSWACSKHMEVSYSNANSPHSIFRNAW